MSLSLPTIGLLVFLAAWIGWNIAKHFTDQTRRFYELSEKVRKAVTILAGIIVAWTLLNSGNVVYVASAFLAIVLGAAYIYVERPHETLV